MTLVDVPEATEIAAKFGVRSPIHADDFMFVYHLGPDPSRWPEVRPGTTEYYFSDGAKSAAHLDELISRFHPEYNQRALRLFEFASGYGMVSRHLSNMKDRYALTACDIHEQAVNFLTNELDIKSVLSKSDPDELALTGGYDVVFALSFFSHAPHRTFGRWLRKLSSLLAENGLLIFTTHGRGGYDRAGRPLLQPEGFCFFSGSEQKDIPSDDYGTILVTPFYTFRQLESCEQAEMALFQEASWWADQDTYVVRKVSTTYRRDEQSVKPT